MEPSIFKFSNINIAKFVVEQLTKRGLNAKALPSGFISIESVLDDAAVALIEEQRGAVVVAGPSVTPVISKFSGAASMVDRRKLPLPTEEPKSPPTANRKTLKKYVSTADSQTKGDIEEAHYSKAGDTAMHIPAKWVYDEFFKLIKDSGAMFNRLKAESTLEYIFGLMHNPKSPYSKYQGIDVLLSSALIEYKKVMGIHEAAEKSAEPASASSKNTSPEELKSFALETLKKVVEKYPSRFPKLAKMFGIKVKS